MRNTCRCPLLKCFYRGEQGPLSELCAGAVLEIKLSIVWRPVAVHQANEPDADGGEKSITVNWGKKKTDPKENGKSETTLSTSYPEVYHQPVTFLQCLSTLSLLSLQDWDGGQLPKRERNNSPMKVQVKVTASGGYGFCFLVVFYFLFL